MQAGKAYSSKNSMNPHVHSIASLIKINGAQPPDSPPSNKPPLLTGTAGARLISVFEPYRTDGANWSPAVTAYCTEAKAAAMRMATAMFRHEHGHAFSLIGQTSVGKSMLMRLLCAWWNRWVPPHTGLREGFHQAEWIDWPSHDWRDIEDAKASRFLVIDEFGRGRNGKASEGAWDRLIDILSFRESRGLWTGLTAQFTGDELRAADGALFQRLRRNGSVCIQAPAQVTPFPDRPSTRTAESK